MTRALRTGDLVELGPDYAWADIYETVDVHGALESMHSSLRSDEICLYLGALTFNHPKPETTVTYAMVMITRNYRDNPLVLGWVEQSRLIPCLVH